MSLETGSILVDSGIESIRFTPSEHVSAIAESVITVSVNGSLTTESVVGKDPTVVEQSESIGGVPTDGEVLAFDAFSQGEPTTLESANAMTQASPDISMESASFSAGLSKGLSELLWAPQLLKVMLPRTIDPVWPVDKLPHISCH